MNFYRSFVSQQIRLPIYRAKNRTLHFLRRSFVWLTDPSVMSMRSRLEKLRGVYAGQRCFIMGNGPSLNQMDLEVFKNEIVWGTNRCYLLFDRIPWRPKFYVAVDKRVVPDNAQEINRIFAELPQTTFFFPVIFREKMILNPAPNVCWFKEVGFDFETLPEGAFSFDISKKVRSAYTVTITALQNAAFMGFNPIYLIGCDTSYSVKNTVNREEKDASLLTSTQDDDNNHFSKEYFGKGKKWNDPRPERMIFQYEQAKKACEQKNIKIINATVGGKLEVFPRIDYRRLF